LPLPLTTPTRQFALLVLLPIKPARIDELRALLETIGKETIEVMRGRPPAEVTLPFQALTGLHYARFVIVDREPVTTPLLAFSTNYDGPEGESECPERKARSLHLDALLEGAGAGLARVFECCEGYVERDFKRYLQRNRVPSQTFFVGAPGRSCAQILWEAQLRRAVDHELDSRQWGKLSPEAIRASICEAIAERPDYADGVPEFPPQPDLQGRVTGLTITLQLALVAAVAGLLFGAWYATPQLSSALYGLLGALVLIPLLGVVRLRMLEERDPQFQPTRSAEADEQLRAASTGENLFLQNPLTHFVARKPGLLRWALLRLVFRALQLLATNVFNHGKLGDIPSIHFARWVFTANGGVLFFSNFDNSWQSYLGDFIDQASAGLTAVWSNTDRYPRTKWLLEAGSRDASRFLAWTRHHQLQTQVWYCAYPGLSIINVNDNTMIRRGLADAEAVDATSWLFRLRSVNRKGADRLYGAEQTRDPALPLEEIQGIILRGYGHKPEARFLLLRVGEHSEALLRWLSELPLTSAADASASACTADPLVNIAFSHAGLRALGVDKTLCSRFSSAFVDDSHSPYRARVNGDIGENAPERWRWGSGENPVHILLMIYASTGEAVIAWRDHYRRQAERCGAEVVVDLEGRTLHGRKEHFGFRDGIAQPIIAGSGRPEVSGNTLAAGEIVLGHRDGYGNVSPSPTTASGFDFGRNGSYLVFRQLSQDVEAFWRYCGGRSEDFDELDGLTVASKMVGRWPSGASLVRHPGGDPERLRFQDEDDFTYLENGADNDRYGARCPFGSHVRRTNPRDWSLGVSRAESLRLANLHRILRRGRPYGPPLDPELRPEEMLRIARAEQGAEDATERGLQFICFNANIERQFEFIQQQWCNNPNFAGLNADPDPLIGARYDAELGADPPTFTIQSDVERGLRGRCTEMGGFVQVRGSAYLFMPSIPAVRLLGTGLHHAPSGENLEEIPADEELHINSIIDITRARMGRENLHRRTLRGRFAKGHACVRATLKVEAGLAPEYRVGLFREPREYRAWVRLSSAAAQPRADSKRDIRGLAIKLMGVPGAKLLEGREDDKTHDLLFSSYPTLMTRDVAETDTLIQAENGGLSKIVGFFVGLGTLRFRAWRTMRASFVRCDDLLAIPYSSVTPYLFGDRAVKYLLRPQEDTRPPPKDDSPDFLRTRLAARLAEGSVAFDLLIQLRIDPGSTPVEDPRIAWSSYGSALVKLATLELPQQVLESASLREFCEQLTFNPWRALPEHRPLGGINRLRRHAYRALAKFRHESNATSPREPTSWDVD